MTTKKYIDVLQFKFESSNLIFCFTKKTMKFPKIKNVTTKWLTVVGGSETNLIQEEEEMQRQRVQGKNEVISYPRGTFIYHLIREIYIGELLGCFPQYVMILMLSHLPVNLSSNHMGVQIVAHYHHPFLFPCLSFEQVNCFFAFWFSESPMPKEMGIRTIMLGMLMKKEIGDGSKPWMEHTHKLDGRLPKGP